MTSQLVTRVDGPPVERQVAADLARRGVLIAPLLLVGAALGWGLDGVLSAAFALVLVLLNFVLSAALLAWAARTSLGLLMGVVLFGYVARLALLMVAVLAISGQAWFSPVPLCATLLVTHLGLLIWETRYVSATLAFPGLKPRPSGDRRVAARTPTEKGS